MSWFMLCASWLCVARSCVTLGGPRWESAAALCRAAIRACRRSRRRLGFQRVLGGCLGSSLLALLRVCFFGPCCRRPCPARRGYAPPPSAQEACHASTCCMCMFEFVAAVLSSGCLSSSVWAWVGDLAQRAFAVPTPTFQLGGGRRRHVVLFGALAGRIPRACSRK